MEGATLPVRLLSRRHIRPHQRLYLRTIADIVSATQYNASPMPMSRARSKRTKSLGKLRLSPEERALSPSDTHDLLERVAKVAAEIRTGLTPLARRPTIRVRDRPETAGRQSCDTGTPPSRPKSTKAKSPLGRMLVSAKLLAPVLKRREKKLV